MNYLAHIYLSFDDPQIMVGNFIADGLSKPSIDHFPEDIQKGIRLHRKIDLFTDTHPIFTQSKRRFSQDFDKFSGILMDIYYDYFLAKNFHLFSDTKLYDYANSTYAILKPYYDIFPSHSQLFYGYMTDRNILFEYSKLSSIELVLYHLSQRIKHPCELHKSIPIIKKHEHEMEDEFFLFFKELISYSKDELASLR